MKGAGMAINSLMGCSNPAGMGEQEKTWKKGAQVCLSTGSNKQLITLMEDVQPGQQTARATTKDGKLIMADVPWLTEYSDCIPNGQAEMDDEEEEEEDDEELDSTEAGTDRAIKIIIRGRK